MTTSPPLPSGTPAWRVLFRMLAAFLALFAFAFWAAAGWNMGWTKTQIVVTEIEPITEIPHITYQDHFAPGLELLSAAIFFSIALFCITFIRRKSTS
jgi:TRAP-type C4-dicarboxylate transport system permease small subunit